MARGKSKAGKEPGKEPDRGRARKEPTLRVDARGASSRALEEVRIVRAAAGIALLFLSKLIDRVLCCLQFESIPQVSCFGLRQKGNPPKGRSEELRRELSLKAAAAAPLPPKQQELQTVSTKASKKVGPEMSRYSGCSLQPLLSSRLVGSHGKILGVLVLL